MSVEITESDFDLSALYARLRQTHPHQDSVGAVVVFVGLVRDMAGDDAITSITLEHYPGMTEAQLQAIRNQAMQHWQLKDAIIIHRIGTLAASAQIVAVGTAAAHRQDAFEANQFIMDYLKTEAPFWKYETSTQGKKWVEARTSDTKAKKRWAKKRWPKKC